MGPRRVEFRKARPGIEGLELRIAPAIVMVNGGGNTPNGDASTTPREPSPAEVRVVGGTSTGTAGGGYVLTGVSHSAL